jgi:hypothetical protein
MANRIKECAYKKSVTFVENMKNFYFLLNQIEIESNSGQVIIKNEISSDSLTPTVEINIKNEIIYPNEENHQTVGSVIHHTVESIAEPKRKKRKNNKKKQMNGTVEIDETGNLMSRQILTTQEHMPQAHQSGSPNLHLTPSGNEMALMLTVKQSDGTSENHTFTVGGQQHTIQPIQIHSSEFLIEKLSSNSTAEFFSDHPLPPLTSTVHHTSHSPPTASQSSIQTSSQPMTATVLPQIQYACSSCNEIFANTDILRQHLLHQHQILFPFSPHSEPQYQVQLPQSSIAQTTILQPETLQYTFNHPNKKYFDSEFPCLLCGVISKNQEDLIKHMIRHTSTAGTSSSQTQTIVERVIDVSSTPTDLSNTTQYK